MENNVKTNTQWLASLALSEITGTELQKINSEGGIQNEAFEDDEDDRNETPHDSSATAYDSPTISHDPRKSSQDQNSSPNDRKISSQDQTTPHDLSTITHDSNKSPHDPKNSSQGPMTPHDLSTITHDSKNSPHDSSKSPHDHSTTSHDSSKSPHDHSTTTHDPKNSPHHPTPPHDLSTISHDPNKSPHDSADPPHDLSSFKARLRKELGLLDCVGLIVGNIIGSGIFVSPRAVLQYTGSVGMSLVIWVLSGIFSMMGALVYTELGTMLPQSGGGYTYLYEAYGSLPAFFELWMGVAVAIPGSRAVGALTFANYVLQPFFPVGQTPPQSALRLIAIVLIYLLTYINSRAVRWATKVQDFMCVMKVFALIVIIIAGMYHLLAGNTENFEAPFESTHWDPTHFATAFYHTFYAYAGWNSLNYVMEELKDPFRNMPRAIYISVSTVTVIYVLTNISYFAVIDKTAMLASTAVAVTFAQLALGSIAFSIPIFVACSTSGSLNGGILTTSRMMFVSARRGHLPKALSFVHIKNTTPVTSLVFTATISTVMFVTSDVTVLINYLSFAGNLLELVTLSTIFYFRIKRPDLHRPIKIWLGFPVMYMTLSTFMVIFPLIRQPMEAVAALVVLATGLPVYYFGVHRKDKPKIVNTIMEKVTYVSQMIFLAVPEEVEAKQE